MQYIFITPWYGNFAGGFEVLVRRYAEYLAAAGYDVAVLTTCSKDPYSKWDKDDYSEDESIINKVKVHRFSTNKGQLDKFHAAIVASQHDFTPDLSSQYDFFLYGIASNNLLNYIEKIDINAKIICGPYFHSLAYHVLKKYPNRIYLWPALHDEPQLQWQPVGDMLSYAKNIFLATEEEKDLAIAYYGRKIGRKIIEAPVIGIPIEVPGDLESKSVLASKYKLPEKYFVYVGRKELGKNVGLLTEWYQKYIDGLNNDSAMVPPLVFIGGGEANLVPADKNYIDLGYISEQDKYSLIANATALINLSLNESFSFVMMEAWLCNTPVIVHYNCEVTKNHCLKSSGGYVVKNFSDFKLALSQLSFGRESNSMAAAGREYVTKNYSCSKVISDFILALNYENID